MYTICTVQIKRVTDRAEGATREERQGVHGPRVLCEAGGRKVCSKQEKCTLGI